MNNKDLIQELSSQLKPVSPLRHLWLYVIICFFLAVVVISLYFVVLNQYSDLSLNLNNPLLLGSSVLLSLLLLYIGATFAIPGVKITLLVRLGAGVLASVFMISLPIAHSDSGESIFAASEHYQCIGSVVIVSVLGLFASKLLMMRLAPTQPRKIFFYCLAASSLLAGASTHVFCSASSISHLTFWHFSMFFLSPWLVHFFGQSLFNWPSQKAG